MSAPVNRRQRRASLATGSSLPAMTRGKYNGPTPTIRVLLVDGADRSVKQIVMKMTPENFTKILGKGSVQWAKLGEIDERIHIMLAGDPTPQSVEPGHRWFEPEFIIADADGLRGPVLHGKAVIFGFAPNLKKAASTPVNPVWAEERVTWLAPDEAAQLRLEDAEKMETEPRQIGEAEEPGPAGLLTVQGNRPLDG